MFYCIPKVEVRSHHVGDMRHFLQMTLRCPMLLSTQCFRTLAFVIFLSSFESKHLVSRVETPHVPSYKIHVSSSPEDNLVEI